MATLWGGVEHPSYKAIASANKLKCIAVTAADWQGFMPGYKAAIEKGISIGNTPGSNTYAVAEYTLAMILSMIRELPLLTNTGSGQSITTSSLQDASVGVVGAGRIGETVINMLKSIGAKNVYYWNRTRKREIESRWAIKYLPLEELCRKVDVITSHVATPAGEIFSSSMIQLMKPGTILVNNGGHGLIDKEALLKRLAAGELRYASDEASFGRSNQDEGDLKELPISRYYHSNSSSAFNTQPSLDAMSDQVTDFIIDVLKNNDKSKAVA